MIQLAKACGVDTIAISPKQYDHWMYEIGNVVPLKFDARYTSLGASIDGIKISISKAITNPQSLKNQT